MNKKTLKLVTSLVAIAMGVLAVVMIFVKYTTFTVSMEYGGVKVESSTAFSGLKTVFGDDEEGITFSFLGLIPFVLSLVAVVLVAIKLILKFILLGYFYKFLYYRLDIKQLKQI